MPEMLEFFKNVIIFGIDIPNRSSENSPNTNQEMNRQPNTFVHAGFMHHILFTLNKKIFNAIYSHATVFLKH